MEGNSINSTLYGTNPEEVMFDNLSKNKDLERGLQQVQANPTQDPTVRLAAEAVLKECEVAKRRRRNRGIVVFLGCIFGAIMILYSVLK